MFFLSCFQPFTEVIVLSTLGLRYAIFIIFLLQSFGFRWLYFKLLMGKCDSTVYWLWPLYCIICFLKLCSLMILHSYMHLPKLPNDGTFQTPLFLYSRSVDRVFTALSIILHHWTMDCVCGWITWINPRVKQCFMIIWSILYVLSIVLWYVITHKQV